MPHLNGSIKYGGGKERDILKNPCIEICQMNMYDNLSGCLGLYDMHESKRAKNDQKRTKRPMFIMPQLGYLLFY